MHSFTMGLKNVPARVLTSAVLTSPSCPSMTSTTRPVDHSFLGSCLSMIKTKSPRLTFLWGCCHLVRCLKSGRNSRVHRRQNTSAKCRTCLHFFSALKSPLLYNPGGAYAGQCTSRWFGVNGSKSLGSRGRCQWSVVYDAFGRNQQRRQH